MATKIKRTETDNNQAMETWRKPLQVPPRADAMRSFYRGAEADEAAESVSQPVEKEKQTATNITEDSQADKIETETARQSPLEKQGREVVQEKARNEQTPANRKREDASGSSVKTTATATNKLTKADLSEKLGIEIEDLFDVNELLRGKSFELYETLLESADENGRCKITQPELMKRIGIKNRRTFYKHEEWLIGLKLLEKRHLPGDHKGVVYRVLEMSEVLPVSNEMLEKFKNRLRNGD